MKVHVHSWNYSKERLELRDMPMNEKNAISSDFLGFCGNWSWLNFSTRSIDTTETDICLVLLKRY